MANKTFDRYASIVFLAIGIFFVVASRGISQSSYGSNVGSNIFPAGLGIILILLSVRLFYEAWRDKSAEKSEGGLEYKRFGIIFAALVLYVFFFERVGYIISTFIFLIIGFQALQREKVIISILISALFTGGVYYLYVNVLQGTLPAFPEWLGF